MATGKRRKARTISAAEAEELDRKYGDAIETAAREMYEAERNLREAECLIQAVLDRLAERTGAVTRPAFISAAYVGDDLEEGPDGEPVEVLRVFRRFLLTLELPESLGLVVTPETALHTRIEQPLTVEQVAKELGVTRHTVTRWVKDRGLPSHPKPKGKGSYFFAREVAEWLRKQDQEAKS